MRRSAKLNILLMAALGIWPILVSAADQPPADESAKPPADESAKPPASAEPVIQPDIERREVKILHIPSNDFEFGLFTGDYNTEYFGSDLVGGARLGYHISEDFFAEAIYGDTRATDQVYRQILPGGIFPNQVEKLRYYELDGGINVLPGEVYVWRNTARPAALYLIAGLGSTTFLDQRHFTVNAGFGARVWLANWVSLQIDMRDHIFSLDVLGQERSTQNLEFSGGVTFFF